MLDLSDVAVGDSIAVNGVCLTVIALHDDRFEVDVSQETINCTVGLDGPNEVNLEKSLRLSDRLGGHLMSGHVDGVGEVTALRSPRARASSSSSARRRIWPNTSRAKARSR